jgi:hypothetical protein
VTVYLGPNKYAYFRRMYRLALACTAARAERNEARRKACNDALERLWKANRGGPHYTVYKP